MSKIAKFGCERLKNAENIASLAKFVNFVKMVAISACNTKVYKIFKLWKAIYFPHFIQHLSNKLCNFTHFRVIFPAVVIYLHLLIV